MLNLKYSDILKNNLELRNTVKGSEFRIAILSNIICHQINEIIEYSLRANGVNASVEQCSYNNILQEAEKCSHYNAVIILWEAANIIDGLYYRINLFNNHDIEKLTDKTIKEINYVINSLKDTPTVIFNKFSSRIFNHHFQNENCFDTFCNSLNNHIQNNIPVNFKMIDTDKILSDISIRAAVDMRNFYSSKALYTVEFYKHYAEYILPILLSTIGHTKKAMIFDCDNTLWKGILGEEGFDGIKMSAGDKDGLPYHEVQNLAVELSRKGVTIGLCSKNNYEDVKQVLLHHRDMVLADQYISIKKINWSDKVTNLKDIANELNISTDSIVYVDDSDFEINYIKTVMPEITAIKVPQNSYEYPSLIRGSFKYFYTARETKEDCTRTLMYRDESLRKKDKERFLSIEEYLQSSDINLDIYTNDRSIVQRMAQLTQKTNQFNLTTKRYSETELNHFLSSENHLLVAVGVKDKFGDSGITALAIISFDGTSAEIDTFLMSCRILGRNIEFKFFDLIIEEIKRKGITRVKASYFKTNKNQQVECFYENMGFSLTTRMDDSKHYLLDANNYISKNIDCIRMN